jgi:hypothetical protein
VISLSKLFDPRAREPETQDIPEGRMQRLRQSFRRRLGDALEEVFHRACIENDLRTAAGLYAVLEDLHQRRVTAHGYDRRISEELLLKARQELDRCRALQQRNKPAPDAPQLA